MFTRIKNTRTNIMAQVGELPIETENVKVEFICVKEEPIENDGIKPKLGKWKGDMAIPEVVYVVEPVSDTVGVEADSEAKLVKDEVELVQSMSLPADAPVLSQMDISHILNDSAYNDESSDEDPDTKFEEHETDGEDSSSDADKYEEETEEGSYTQAKGATCAAKPDEDTHPSGYGTDRSTGSQASNNWHRTRFKKTKPDMQYPASLLDTTDTTDISKYFHQYLDDEIFDRIVQSTNQTALHKNGKQLDFTRDECKILFGIIITMSCINYPNIRMYWNRKWAIELISKAMARDRFMQLRHSLKLVFDEDVIEEVRASDQLWKVRPIINRVLEGCHRQKRHQDISINEMIIPLKGTCPVKHYFPDKPYPTGIKILVLVNPDGLICDFVTYQGKNNSAEEMILHLTRTLIPGHILYFNQCFTTIELVKELNRNGIKCVGGLMKSRLPKDAKSELLSDKALARQGRGSHDVLVSSDGEIAITKWFDNRSILFLSSIYAAETGGYCIRYDRKRRRLRVPRPEVVREHDTIMGAVGVSERLLAACPSKMRASKWTLRFMLHFVNLAVCNSWIQYKNDMQTQQVSAHKTYTLWAFKRLIGEFLIESSLDADTKIERNDDETHANKRGRPPVVSIPSKVIRTRGNEHLPQMKIVGRCRRLYCDKKTMVSCITCKVNLCLTRNRNCFKEFHTNMSV